MKFAHELTAALENYPATWAQAAIPYGRLKKVLVKVRRELLRRGYDPETLRALLRNHFAEYRVPESILDLPVAAGEAGKGKGQGQGQGQGQRPLSEVESSSASVSASVSASEDARCAAIAHPRLFVRAPVENAFVARVMASVGESSDTPETGTPETGSTPESESEMVLDVDLEPEPDVDVDMETETEAETVVPSEAVMCYAHGGSSVEEQQQQQKQQQQQQERPPGNNDKGKARDLDDWCSFSGGRARWIEVPLEADGEFFSTLQTNVEKLDALQGGEQHSLQGDITRLGGEVASLSRPGRWSKSDLYRWREIFRLYLDADIFFSTVESEPGAHDARKAHERLVWFQNEVAKRAILGKFKLPASMVAYKSFLELNARTLRNVQFQELNRTALKKIIKKFDKQTSLHVSRSLSGSVRSGRFVAEDVARNVCAELSRNVLARVPQTVDHNCPVCQEICWIPIRLKCQHLFCIRCMVSMQKQEQNACPLCRAPTVLDATTADMDEKVIKYLETWFRKEVREKQIQNENERGRDLFGPDYERGGCAVM